MHYDNKNFMPTNLDALKILNERAEIFAKNAEQDNTQSGSISYIRFRLGEHEYYGIPFHYAREIMQNNMLTKVPFSKNFIAGVINRRGSLIAVLNLKYFFHTETSNKNNENFIIIATYEKTTIGILVDGIEGNESYNLEQLEASIPSEGVSKQEYILGLHRNNTTIIDIKALLSDINLIAGK